MYMGEIIDGKPDHTFEIGAETTEKKRKENLLSALVPSLSGQIVVVLFRIRKLKPGLWFRV